MSRTSPHLSPAQGLRRSIRRRLALALVAFAAACLALGLSFAYLGAVLPHHRELDAELLGQAAELLERVERDGHEALVAEIARRSAELGGEGWQFAYWRVGSGELLAGNRAPPGGAIRRDGLHDFRLDGRPLRAAVYRLAGERALLVGHDVAGQALFERRLVLSSVAACAFVIVASIGGGLWLSRALLLRVLRMNDTVLSILGGRRAERVPGDASGDEFDELAKHFNALLDENERLLSQVREVTHDIAHDLRTPLAHVRVELERALARPRSADEDARVLREALGEIDGVLDTFQALLSIARIESGAERPDLTAVDLAAIARDVVELYAPAAEEAGLAMELDAPEPVAARGDRQLLAQALSNLVENAIKFARAPGAIRVAARAAPEGAELSVADRGPGIPEGEREHVLKPFVRLDAARGTPGTGLGLSLVAAIVRLHGARLRLSDNAPGLVATIAFAQ